MLPQHTVSELHRHITGWKIRVKVLRKWYTISGESKKTLEFVLCDDQGTNQIGKYEDELNESKWKIITFFSVKNAFGTSNVVCNNIKIDFLSGTIVEQTYYTNRNNLFSFVDYEIISMEYPLNNYLVDINGRVQNVSDIEEVYHFGNETNIEQLCFTFFNERNKQINCLVWGGKDQEIKNKLNHATPGGNDVCILRWWKIDTLKGKDIHAYGEISDIMVNPDIEEVIQFRTTMQS
ncbi:hypothetical protein AALP_AAs65394U000200 [Arabis alpina]|uniref:Replication protein A 70 kDa DNA-binding subunit B/D first OB fold domain-containing protein n=1 Tax=Arabis alpina TaxID=50452 RepID=A0A087G0V4_ARAAL|nr:hypothetical protein AALP_AAs65394U000200 [Arabis alpina]